MKKRTAVLIALTALFVGAARADGIKSLRLSEVAVGDSLEHSAWIEIQNTSWGTQDLGGFYITNDPAVFNENLTPPQRMQRMHLIPTGDPATAIAPQNCILLYADGHDNIGILHLNFTLQPGDIVAIYNGNGKDLVDSLTIPLYLKPNQSWAKDFEKGTWSLCGKPTPTLANNYETAKRNNKIAEFKEKDPYGIAMSIMAMGIVFACLALLYVFFKIFGYLLTRNEDKTETANGTSATGGAHSAQNDDARVAALMAVSEATSGTGNEAMDMALIALALEDALVHDEESGVITIHQTPSPWADKAIAMEEGLLH